MSKTKTAFFCSNCGQESAKWLGKCPSCEQWNTFVEEVIVKGTDKKQIEWKEFSGLSNGLKTISLENVTNAEEKRIITGDAELNRVLGGGIVGGSLVLVAGEPGIGKSTLFLQDALQLKDTLTLYISGEESDQQIKMRADRLQIKNEKFFLLTETNTQTIFNEIRKLKPELVIVDSNSNTSFPLYRIGTGQCITNKRDCCGISTLRKRNQYTGISYRPYYKRWKHRGAKNS